MEKAQADLKDEGEALANIEQAADARHDLASQQGVASNVEEVGIHADLVLLQHLLHMHGWHQLLKTAFVVEHSTAHGTGFRMA